MFGYRWLKFASVICAGLVMAAASYGYATSNSISASRAGDGTGAISTYGVSGVQFGLDVNDPSLITRATFSLAGSVGAQTAAVRFNTSGTWYGCSISGGTNVICTINPAIRYGSSLTTMEVLGAQ